MTTNVKNDAGVFNARLGMFGTEKSVFTHWDPETNRVWGEDLLKGQGAWVPQEKVEWL